MKKVEFGAVDLGCVLSQSPVSIFSVQSQAASREAKECPPQMAYGSTLLGCLQDSGRWGTLKHLHCSG